MKKKGSKANRVHRRDENVISGAYRDESVRDYEVWRAICDGVVIDATFNSREAALAGIETERRRREKREAILKEHKPIHKDEEPLRTDDKSYFALSPELEEFLIWMEDEGFQVYGTRPESMANYDVSYWKLRELYRDSAILLQQIKEPRDFVALVETDRVAWVDEENIQEAEDFKSLSPSLMRTICLLVEKLSGLVVRPVRRSRRLDI